MNEEQSPSQKPKKEVSPLACSDAAEITAAFKDAEAHWTALIAAAEGIQACAHRLKESSRSIDGYNMEKALGWHRIEKMRVHLQGLQIHCQREGIRLKAEGENVDSTTGGNRDLSISTPAEDGVSTWKTGRPMFAPGEVEGLKKTLSLEDGVEVASSGSKGG